MVSPPVLLGNAWGGSTLEIEIGRCKKGSGIAAKY